MKKKLTFYQLFWIFLIGCVCGWFIEGVYDFFRVGRIFNHSSLIYGPIGGAYGIGAILITLFLHKFEQSSYPKIFFVSFIIGTIAEYIMSWGMELVLGFTAWNYSHLFLNINGRVCLLLSLFWGILGIVWIKWIFPLLNKMIDMIPTKVGNITMYILIGFLAIDIFISYAAVTRQKERFRLQEPTNWFDHFLDEHYTDAFLEKVFPGITKRNK